VTPFKLLERSALSQIGRQSYLIKEVNQEAKDSGTHLKQDGGNRRSVVVQSASHRKCSDSRDETSSPAVAERPHDASCLSVVSFDSTAT